MNTTDYRTILIYGCAYARLVYMCISCLCMYTHMVVCVYTCVLSRTLCWNICRRVDLCAILVSYD